jgi:hypothetical protein
MFHMGGDFFDGPVAKGRQIPLKNGRLAAD